MMNWTQTFHAPDEHGHRLPGEGPSADRRDHGEKALPMEDGSDSARHEILNQDGTRLGSWEGGSVGNPTGSGIGELRQKGEYVHAEEDHLPIGADTTVLPEDGEHRTFHAGIAGGASPSDRGTSGQLGGDPSNIGVEGDDQYGE